MELRFFAKTFFALSTFLFVFSVSFFLSPNSIRAETIFEEGLEILSDTTWTKSEGPYVLYGDVIVRDGSRLTIEEGTQIIFDSRTSILVEGSIFADGTEDEPVIFTSVYDDGTLIDPDEEYWGYGGFWDGIWLFEAEESRISHAEILFSRDGISLFKSADFTLESVVFIESGYVMDLYESDANISNVLFSRTVKTPLQLFRSNLNIENLEISDVLRGPAIIAYRDSSIIAEGLEIKNVENEGVIVYQSTLFDVDNLKIENVGGYGSIVAYMDSEVILDNSLIKNTSSNSGISAYMDTSVSMYNTTLDNAGSSMAIETFVNSDIKIDNSVFQNGNRHGIYAFNGANIEINESTIKNFTESGLVIFSSETNVSIAKSKIENNKFGIYSFSNPNITINESTIADNTDGGLFSFSGTKQIDASSNFWGHASGPYNEAENPDGLGNEVFSFTPGMVNFSPWLTYDPLDPCLVKKCVSSVLFLPGIMGSRLSESDETIWEPGGKSDVEKLYMDEKGKSTNTITATEVIGEFDGPAFFNVKIYESFLSDLSVLKENKTINDYTAYAYDWRLSIEDILESGKIETELKRLADESQTGKVSIVAHSNGGLLTKALLNEIGLESSSIVDKVILVAVPQIGTPKAFGGLLHGFDTGISFVISAEDARELAINAPMTYQLLPHIDYKENAGVSIEGSMIEFGSEEIMEKFVSSYGNKIEDIEALRNFLLNSDGREKPKKTDLKNPAIANGIVMGEVNEFMKTIGSDWIPPEGVTVHQIAGIGEDTLSGIKYVTVKECVSMVATNSYIPMCFKKEDRLSYKPIEVVDGDGTVVTPSALAMSEGENVKRWWVDLKSYNSDTKTLGSIFKIGSKKIHHNILEIENLRKFIINNLVTENSEEIGSYIYESKPNIESGNRLKFTLHSPLVLSARDHLGNEIGPELSEILDGSYSRYGEVQTLNLHQESLPTIILSGISEGSFTLEIEEYTDGLLTDYLVFSGIPSDENTYAEISFSNGNLSGAGNLLLDYDIDGTFDYQISTNGEESSLHLETGENNATESSSTTKSSNSNKENVGARLIIVSTTKPSEVFLFVNEITKPAVETKAPTINNNESETVIKTEPQEITIKLRSEPKKPWYYKLIDNVLKTLFE